MAATFTKLFGSNDKNVGGQEYGRHSVIATLNLGAYATDGVLIDATALQPLGLSDLDMIMFSGTSADGLLVFAYDTAAKKVLAFNTTNGLEVTDAVDLTPAAKHVNVEVIQAI